MILERRNFVGSTPIVFQCLKRKRKMSYILLNKRCSGPPLHPDPCVWIKSQQAKILRNEFDFWNVHGIMNISGLLQSK